MGALLFTIAWVAMVPLGVFVLLIGIASVRNGLVKRVFRCEQSRSLSDIGVATPPQSFQYLSEDALQVLA